ncbi:PAS domain-containing hybrid sensor histidine kinase/response regulator [Terricaulis silvestris]|uniref:histidine kinase n=1 Tax=Terricaulis silvestris TaxID=2686094 RepID=A0A6I6MKJ0_9CAUL|nr:PAS domain-containing hybrid sensor histidine kinase/response regulator [Terricaulis silvestris]QGZ95855.1 Autoinducer 2 sensor kinase/phosphatase LuxQ [Terricaulis silvestris]
MFNRPPTALASAAETRRREMPASVALVILTGGIAAAIMGGAGPVGWAAAMSLLLVLDTELYRRLDSADVKIEGRAITALSAWSFVSSAFYATLPIALWLHGEAAGAAAAMLLWVAGVVRHFSPGVSGAWPIALAGAAPPALSLLVSPFLIAAMASRPDWDIAVIAAIGGGALMAYVTLARVSASEAERALRTATLALSPQQTLANLLLETEGVAVLLMDRNDCIIAASDGLLKNLGRDDVRGLTFEDIVPMPRERWRAAFESALRGEGVRHPEDEIILPTGRHYFDWETRPWRDQTGEICGVFAAGRDITSLVEARKAVVANEDRLRMALDAGRSVVWEVDYKEQQIHWYGDHTAIFGPEGFTFEQFDINTTSVIHNDDRDMLAAYFTEIAAGESHSVEHRVMRVDGSVAWVESYARRVLGRSGSVRKFVVMSKDITDRKAQEAAFIAAMQRAEAALRDKRALFEDVGDVIPERETSIAEADISVADMYDHLAGLMEEMNTRDSVLAQTMASLRAAREAADAANVSKSQFLTSMSHELRTPLNAIIGYSEILREEAEADERATDIADIDRVLSAARQLLHLINEILDLSKIEAGRMDVVASEFAIASVIKEAAATVRPSIEKNGSALKLDIAPDVGEGVSDPFKLNQCLLNLLSNAAKFTRDGAITVTARREGEWVEIAVADTGIGMSEDQVSRLFNAFVQADALTARRYGGTGLGLALTRRMMQLLGGDVAVKSVQGKGSTFTLRFPTALQSLPAPAARIESSAVAGQGRERIVLLIDDEESARDLAARSLTRLGFKVKAAITGEEGIALARTLRPSLIVLDINLPDVTGWDVLTVLLTGDTGDIPVLVHSIDDNRKRALAAGACEHLVKPADRDVLAAAALRLARAPELSKPAIAPVIATRTKTA